ncbi:MAG: hypothetical protein A2452_04150 [Candidatus Firestonebacteria bacterium RIFOXYC2_FULL_39_67]|nr:MAG: hypothetical protein A2536_08995 [Candidatus Firestonebacteria bacterium RIFOXYD2_FULL_39_29]OGF56154.1 MAG: hypothetical protein A2452_04150 [Candidatus Firestonebacteria bacterium RIFOXYC2_FULL_39_67]
MEKAKVYFADARSKIWNYDYSLPAKLEELLEKVDLSKYISPKDKVAVKTHFGSQGAFRIVRPVFIRKIVDAVKCQKAKPFVTDTTRIESLDYLEVAAYNGLTHLSCGAPVIIADGIKGMDSTPVKVEGHKHISEISVANAIYHADAMIVVSHFKGHLQAGFGGAIKNIGMGGVSPKTHDGKNNRGRLHSVDDKLPAWDKAKCTLCRRCEAICPTEAVIIKGKNIEIIDEACWRCGRCARICKEKALDMPITSERLNTHIIEASKAVMSTFKPKKVIFINFMIEMQPECDCMPMADVPVVNDQGIALSDDPVAVDQACINIVAKAKPLPDSLASDLDIAEAGDTFGAVNRVETKLSLEIGEKMGLGSRKYELIKINKKTKKSKPEEWE